MEEVASSSVVKEPPDGESLLDVTECCEFLDAHRRETIERLQKRYRAIGPLLGKVEELIAGTNTGRSARLRGYYRHWEREMFFALNALVLNSLEDLGVLFEARDPRVTPGAAPLFKIHVLLNPPDIVPTPSLKEVDRLLAALAGDAAESPGAFTRWMDGTCLLYTSPSPRDLSTSRMPSSA